MRLFHIVFTSPTDQEKQESKNIEALTMIQALIEFNRLNKGIKPIYIEDKGEVNP